MSIKTITVTILIVAAMSPTITLKTSASTSEKVNVLIDDSKSMKVTKTINQISKYPKTTIIEENNSKIFSQAAKHISKNTSYLLISDGKTKEQPKELIKQAKAKNSSISFVELKEKKEKSVEIIGPETTVPGAQNEYKIKLYSTKESATPIKITLDGKTIFSDTINTTYSFNRAFEDPSTHRIKAEIQSDDIFQQNNKYYKTVKVREKPKILTIGTQGSLERNLENFYDIENREKIPSNLENYYSIIMKNNIRNERINEYIASGNGLVYTSKETKSFPEYLPVTKAKDSQGEKGAEIILLIDASLGTGGECTKGTENFCLEKAAEGGTAKQSIKIAYSLVDKLSGENRVGVIGYSRGYRIFSNPKTLASNREKIKESISRIEPNGPSFHNIGLKKATDIADQNDTIVMLTDGEIGEFESRKNVPKKLREAASKSEAKLITVGVGEQPNEELLTEISKITKGYHLENNEAGRLKFKFGVGGGNTKYTPINVVNPNHFITEGIEMEGTTTKFIDVKTKTNAQELVSDSRGREYLTTWRYGLGRVATFSGGNKNLNRISASDPELISKTIAWTVGNPFRKEKTYLTIKDASKPSKPSVQSTKPRPGLTKVGENLYEGSIDQTAKGFHTWNNETYAYNYNKEIKDIGQDYTKLSTVAQKTGGKIYQPSKIDNIRQLAKTKEKINKSKVSLMPFLLVIALLSFLTEVAIRKRNGRL